VPDTDLILVVEEREDDILLLQRAFQKVPITNPVHYARTGEEAIAYLSGDAHFSNRAEYPLPALVILELKLPGMDGFQVLSWIRQHYEFRTLPVVVLTASTQIRDINRAYLLGANSFFLKEIDLQQTVVLSGLIQQRWLQNAANPESSYPALKSSRPSVAVRQHSEAPATSAAPPSSPSFIPVG
jgi:CheY-like chemotaxis protein